MPNLNFQITGAEAVMRGITPLLHFKLRISDNSGCETIQAVLLSAQIQIQCPQRAYSSTEKEKLIELFGSPDRWGQTLRNRFWTHAQVTLGAFRNETETFLPVACTYDLNIASAKYFYALESGEVSLLFLFSGSVFYAEASAGLQMERISWNKECSYRVQVQTWRELMDLHYPNSAWLSLRQDIFDNLCEYKRRKGAATWDQAIERLLADQAGLESIHRCEEASP